MAFTVRELSPRTLADFAHLAVQQGSCWCMYYQRPTPVLRGSTAEKHRAINRRDKAKLVRAGRSHAILVYEGETAIGWCQYGPREELPRIDAGRNYRKVALPEAQGRLWRITCFFVDRAHRGRGVAKVALKAALASIKQRGGALLKPTLSSRRRWRPCRNGAGLGLLRCFRKRVSGSSLLWARAASSCGRPSRPRRPKDGCFQSGC